MSNEINNINEQLEQVIKKQLEEIQNANKSTSPLPVFLSYIFLIYNIGALNPFIEAIETNKRILLFLKTNGSNHPSMISTALNIPRPNVAIALKQLEKDKYITRINSKEDKRQCLICLTKKGDECALQLIQNLEDLFNSWLNSLNNEQKAALFDILHTTVNKMVKWIELYHTPFFNGDKTKKE